MKIKYLLFLFLFFVIALQNLVAQCSVSITPSGATTICEGDSLTLVASGSDVSWNWSPSTGLNTTTTGNTVIAALTTTTTYTVTRTCTSGTATYSVTITVDPLPTISGTLAVCVGNTTTLTGSATPATTTPWVSGTTSVATVNSAGLVTGVAVGTSVITYTNSNGCIITEIVTVNAPAIVSAGPDILVCKGNPINLTSSVSGNGSNTVTYTWTGPNGYSSTSSSPTIANSTIAMSGNYTVTATIGACQTQDVVNVTVA